MSDATRSTPKRTGLLLAGLLLVGLPTLVTAGSIAVPNAFQDGTVASAEAVNQNFAALAGAVNDNDERLDAVEADYLTSAGGTVAALHANSLSSSCASGWTALNRGRLCMSGLLGPHDVYTAMSNCRSIPGSGLHAHVCSYAEMQTACANGVNPFGGVTPGWYGDLSGSDDAFHVWNYTNCQPNSGGPPQPSGNANRYRCCY